MTLWGRAAPGATGATLQALGVGEAHSGSGSYASNSYPGLVATRDYHVAGQAPDQGSYEGELIVYGEVDYGPYSTTPRGTQFSADARVLGSGLAQGAITVHRSPYFASFWAHTTYWISGSGTFVLTGDIRDLE